MTVATVLSRCCYDCAPAEEIEVCHTIHIGLTQQLQPAVFTLTGLGSSFLSSTQEFNVLPVYEE